MASTVCAQFNSSVETVQEFMERFKVQCSDLLAVAGDNDFKKVTVLIKALPLNVVTDLQRRIKPVKLSEVTYDLVVEKLTGQYEVKKSVIGASVQFLNHKQSPHESIENYAKTLNDLASLCKYADCCRDRHLRDRFVSGIHSKAVLTALIQDCETDKKFNECVEKAKVLEQLSNDAQDIKLEPKINSSYKVEEKSKNVPSDYVCIRCSTRSKHYADKCFAVNLTCKKCNKKGHIAKACRSKINKASSRSMVNTVYNQERDINPSPSPSVISHTSSPNCDESTVVPKSCSCCDPFLV